MEHLSGGKVPSYDKSSIKTLVKMPKGFVRDSGLLHYLLQIDQHQKLLQNPIVGHSFEGFVIEEILTGLQAKGVVNWQPYYFRTRRGIEVDLVLQGSFGLLPIEIKYGSHTPPKQLKALQSFIDEHDCKFGLLINQSDRACWLTHTIFQMPALYL